MGDVWNWEELPFDSTLFEKVNPVFNTAKLTLYQLAGAGDPDALAIVKNMGLTREETQNSANTTASPEQVLSGMITLETRYRTMANLAEQSGYTLVDMPCGYTPRAVSFAKKGIPYYGLDLPVVIQETAEQIKAMIPEEKQNLVHFKGVDATNYASLEAALEDIEGKVCINTEGLLMYFTDSECEALCDNIRRILLKKGGCWYTADPECALQHVITVRSLVGDRFMEIMKNGAQQTKDKADVEIGKNSLVITALQDVPGGIKNAMAFLAKHGLVAERVTIVDYMPKLTALEKVSPEQAAAIMEGMKHCAFWKITPSSTAVDMGTSETEGFQLNARFQENTLFLTLTGRLDTITSPHLLSFFEKSKAEHTPQAVEVDCSHLDYISSAGLRVLLIMHKACQDGVTLRGLNALVTEILAQTGFDSILKIQ